MRHSVALSQLFFCFYCTLNSTRRLSNLPRPLCKPVTATLGTYTYIPKRTSIHLILRRKNYPSDAHALCNKSTARGGHCWRRRKSHQRNAPIDMPRLVFHLHQVLSIHWSDDPLISNDWLTGIQYTPTVILKRIDRADIFSPTATFSHLNFHISMSGPLQIWWYIDYKFSR